MDYSETANMHGNKGSEVKEDSLSLSLLLSSKKLRERCTSLKCWIKNIFYLKKTPVMGELRFYIRRKISRHQAKNQYIIFIIHLGNIISITLWPVFLAIDSPEDFYIQLNLVSVISYQKTSVWEWCQYYNLDTYSSILIYKVNNDSRNRRADNITTKLFGWMIFHLYLRTSGSEASSC